MNNPPDHDMMMAMAAGAAAIGRALPDVQEHLFVILVVTKDGDAYCMANQNADLPAALRLQADVLEREVSLMDVKGSA